MIKVHGIGPATGMLPEGSVSKKAVDIQEVKYDVRCIVKCCVLA